MAFLLFQLKVPAATFWADKCAGIRVKANEEMQAEGKMAVQSIRSF